VIAAESFTFEIHPDDDLVPLTLFERTIEDVRRLVKDVDYAVTRRRVGRTWVVTRLQSSAPAISIRPATDSREVIGALMDGLRMVVQEQTTEPPPHFTADALDDLKRMQRLFRGHQRARQVVFSTNGTAIAVIDRAIGEKVERIFRGTYTVLGSLEGMLDAINLHRTPTFTIWDRVSGGPVRCQFPGQPDWIERVKARLQKRVLVVGQVSYFKNGVPRAISQVRDLRDMTPDATLPPATFGSILDETAKRDPVKYVKVNRE